ncbi:MAG TPA: TolC family protein [Phaeodactylibacter sp.]|nr:TolC family protein [Phaeodactylibacter sp.]
MNLNFYKTLILHLLAYAITFSCFAQNTMKLSLEETIAKAQQQSPSFRLAKAKWTSSRSLLRATMADFKPQISLQGTLPELQRSNLKNRLDNGEQVFLRSASLGSALGLRMEQSIARTGGTVFLGTGLDYSYNFAIDGRDASRQFASDLIYVGIEQPLFGFNSMKWQKELAPIQYAEATRRYAEEMESIALQCARLFFDLYEAQLTLAASQKQKSNADSLYEISKGRFSVGRIAETDLLQIELSAMNARATVAAEGLKKQRATEALRNFLGIKDPVIFDLQAPTDLPSYLLDIDKAVQLANNNRSKSYEFQRRLLQSEREIAQVDGSTGLQANLFARVGLSQNAKDFADAYKKPEDAEFVTLGFQIPIADWGKAKARRNIARSNYELERMNIEQEQINMEQEIILRVQQFDLLRQQVALALRAYEVSQKTEGITRKRYLIGKIDVTELNLSIQAMDAARKKYINALRAFWLAHYEIRALTLYDFVRGVSLVRGE